ncbi:MAG: PAS domain-containing protein, partial [Deltaproteobacteria bacterium]|nr:PAS domain-containing protein [Candidatus Tharpella aukensis]
MCNNKSDSPESSCEELRQRAIRAEECCTEMQTRLDELERISNIGSWEWEFDNNHLSWSKGTYDIFGLPEGPYNQDNYASFLAALHPGDQSMVSRAINEALEHQSIYSLDYRIIRADNQKERIIHA